MNPNRKRPEMMSFKVPGPTPQKGRIVERITIEVDHNTNLWVEAVGMASDLAIAPTVMDSRRMVLLLQKVALDYTSALFNLQGAQANAQGQQETTDDKSTNTDPPVS